VDTRGNVLAATAFLQASPRREEMDHHDPDQVSILVRAVKPAPGN
jgi:hypothetical protein